MTENVFISSTLCLTSSTESFRQEFVSGLRHEAPPPCQCWWRQHDKQITRDLLVVRSVYFHLTGSLAHRQEVFH